MLTNEPTLNFKMVESKQRPHLGAGAAGNVGKLILKANGPIQWQRFGSCDVDGCHDGGE
jgi:hypothetical protein